MKINQTFIHTIKGIAIGIVLVAGISYVQAAWAPPAGAPSEVNNAPAPINVSSENQYKEGWLLVGGTGTPISALDVSNGTDTAQAVADMALVTKTSRFVQTAKFGDLITGSTSGKVNVLGSEAKVNVGYGEIVLPAATPEKLNVRGSILSSDLQNDGPGFDLTLKGEADDWYPTMLCADTNGKIVLCRDLPGVPYVEEEYIPISVDLTPSNIAEATDTIGCNQDNYSFTTSISGTDTTPTYTWSIVKTAGPGVGIFWTPATFSGNSEDASFYRDNLSTRTYSITVTATDDEGNTDSDSSTINIQSVSWYETVELGGGASCPE